jgi:hypothetical protein
MALPAPTASTATVDYIPAGTSRFTFVPTIASPGAPTSAELAAGTDYTSAITSRTGFTSSSADVDNSTYGSRTNTNIPGAITIAQSTWVLKADKLGADARAALTQDLNGFVVDYPGGIVTGGKCNVWPVRVSSSDADTVGRDALATISVMFSTTGVPSKNIAIPTA